MATPLTQRVPTAPAPVPEAGGPVPLAPLPPLRLPPARAGLEGAALVAFVAGPLLLALAVWLTGGRPSAYLDVAALVIVLGGTACVAITAHAPRELGRAVRAVGGALSRRGHDPQAVALMLLRIADFIRKAGPRGLTEAQKRVRGVALIEPTLTMLADNLGEAETATVLEQDREAAQARAAAAAALLRRAADAAPAMGLIGTLVGLVEMLGRIDDPGALGPAMAVALLTTLYGAVLGTMVLQPLAGAIERRAEEDALSRHLVRLALPALARGENPRRLEPLLNAALPPADRVSVGL